MKWFGRKSAAGSARAPLTRGWASGAPLGEWPANYEAQVRTGMLANPVAPPPTPTDVTATAGDRQVTINWTALPEATSYDLYRGIRSGRPAKTSLASNLSAAPYVDTTVENGSTYFYTVIARNAGGSSPRSA